MMFSRHFDFVVGFGGDGVLAYVTCPSILQFISLVSDDTTSDIFDIAVDCFGERDVVSLHPVIVISRAPRGLARIMNKLVTSSIAAKSPTLPASIVAGE